MKKPQPAEKPSENQVDSTSLPHVAPGLILSFATLFTDGLDPKGGGDE